MRFLLAALVPALLLSAAAQAEQRTFTVANNPDGYGIDRCLAAGAPCGVAAATAYCRARDFAKALAFHRIERDARTPIAVTANDCRDRRCEDLVAIECSR